MGVPSLVALVVLTTLALFLRFAPRGASTIGRAQAEQVALEHVGSGRVTHSHRARRAGRWVFRVIVREPAGRVHDLDIDIHEGRVIDESIRAPRLS